MILRINLLLILVIIALPCNAEIDTIRHINLRQVAVANGLSQNTVNHFYEDNQGFIWISTQAGLNRFDGESIFQINALKNKLTTSAVNSLFQDKQQNLWISTDQGLIFIDQDQSVSHLSHFPSQQKYQSSANMLIGTSEEDAENMWIFSWNGIYSYHLRGRDITQPESMSIFHSQQNNLLSFEKDNGQFWLGSTQGLYLFNPKDLSLKKVNLSAENSKQEQFSNLAINAIKKLDANQLVISTNLGLYRLDITDITNVQLNLLATGYTSNISVDNHLVYFSNSQDIKTYHSISRQVTTLFSLSDVLPKYSTYKIKTLFVDSQHLLWIGTYSQGAFVWDTQSFSFESWSSQNKNSHLRLNHDFVWSIDEDNQGNFWIGTETGLNYFAPEKQIIDSIIDVKTTGATTENLKIYDLLETKNSLWIASGDGLLNYNLNHKTLRSFFPKFKKKNSLFTIFSLVSIQPDQIWLATNIGILKFDTNTKHFSYDKHIMPRINAKPTRLLEYHNGLLWIGLADRLITYSIIEKQANTIFKSEKNTKDNHALLMDLALHNNKLWLTYKEDGIYIIDLKDDNKVIKHLHSSIGFPDNTIYSLLNSDGYIWASSTQGLIRVATENYQHVIFDHQDGLISNEFNEGAALRTKNGYFLYGGPTGLTRINPSELKESIRQRTTKITSVDIFSPLSSKIWSFTNSNEINLNNSQDAINVSFSSFDFINPKDWQYEYWLEGAKQSEPRITKYPQLLLSDFPSGETIFNVRAILIEDGSPSKRSKLKIIGNETPTFTIPKTISTYLVIFLIVSWFTYRRYLTKKKSQLLYKQLEENEKRLELALFDDRRGVWDCLIDQDNLENSSFIVYQNKHEPLHLTLKKYFTLVHTEDIAQARKSWIEFLSGKKSSFFETYRSFFDQRWIWNRIYGKVNDYYASGHPKRATGIWTDINQEKKIEDKLNLYSHAFQSTQDIVFILDNDLIITVVNQAYENTTGFSGDAMIGKSMVDVAFSRFTEKETKNIKKQVQENKRWHGESSVPRRNAPSFSASIRINVITKDNKDSGYVVVMSDISQLEQSKKPTFDVNFYDKITGLPNKALAFDRLRQLLKQCKTNQQKLSIIFLSIDHLEKIKTMFDSDTVNALLIRVSNRLLPYIKKNDVLAIYEQDTFIIILRHVFDDDDILHTVNQLLKETSKTFIINDHSIDITACAGISSYPDDGGNWSELITKSETALAQTRQQGKNLFKYYDEGSNQKALDRVNFENSLNQAVQSRELFLVYQPLLKLKTMKTIELDVNLRWGMEDNRIVYPSQFLPIAEETGMLDSICDWQINALFSSLSRWNQEGLKLYININLPVAYLMAQNTVNFIKEKLSFYRIDPADIFIAIHENNIKNNISELVDTMSELNSIGVQLVLDGFGKSSASLQNLQKIQFHSIKLDRNLIRNIGKNKFNDRVLQGIISLLNDLRLGSVAKGIETEQQLEFLLQHKCRYGQGYLFSDPLNENQMRQYLLNHP